ncbi:MAG: TonB-dependent receptor [Owenweeksia sp.]
MKRYPLAIAVGIAGFQLLVSPLQAQTNDTLKAGELEEVTIRAVRAEENAPVSQVTISREKIEKVYTGQDGAFLLEEISPSIVSYSESGTGLSNYGQMRLRGIDQSRINITLNGVPLNDMLDQGVFFSNFTDFGNSIESVQIQRGVGTSTNGVASYAGSINFESLSLTGSQPATELQLTGGSFGTARASAEVHTGLMKNRTSFYSRVSHIQSDGYRYNTGTNSNSLFFSGGYFGDKHALKLTGFAGRSQNGLAYSPVALSDIKNDPRTNYISPNDIDDFGQWLFQLQHTWRLALRTSLVTTAYYGGAGGDFPFGYVNDSGNFEQINYPLYNDHYGLMSFVNHDLANEKTKLSAGIHGYTFKRNNVEYVIPNRNSPYYDDRTQKDEVSVFGKVQQEWGKFELFGDVQVRAVQISFSPDPVFLGENPSIPNRNYLFINPKIGVTYEANDNWQLYASYGKSGREPTRFDILGSTQINASNLPILQDEKSVDPEYVNDIEAGVRWRTEKINLQANGFYMLFENEIAPIGRYIPEGFVQVYRNQESSYRAGMELSGAWQFLPDFQLRAQATYLNARISSYQPDGSEEVYKDVTPILSPELNLLGTLAYQPVKSLEFSVSGRYLSESFMELTNDPALTVPASMVFDMAARWNFWRQHSLSVQFNNITDELYYTYGAPDASGTGPAYFVQPPRHVYATLTLKF